MKNLIKELYNEIKNSDFLEYVRCSNPFHSYPLIYKDSLTGCSNGRALRRDISKLPENQSVAIYAVDVVGLKLLNDKYGHDYGDNLIRLGSEISKKAVSKFGGKIYREYGDDYTILVPDIDEEDAQRVASRIDNLCRIINENRVYNNGHFDIHLNALIRSIPSKMPIVLHIGYVFSPDGKKIYDYLDESRENLNRNKREFYTQHPKLDMRNGRTALVNSQ